MLQLILSRLAGEPPWSTLSDLLKYVDTNLIICLKQLKMIQGGFGYTDILKTFEDHKVLAIQRMNRLQTGK
jgi:hypothetical protein